MAARPPSSPSPQARRQAQQLALQAALTARNPQLVNQLLGQWVHRHGVGSLDRLWAELARVEPEGATWWQGLAGSAERIEPQLPRPARPAPAPSHPALLQLRSWLPDQENRRAA